MINLTEKAAAALTTLRGSVEFRHLMEWLEEDLAHERQRCVELDGVALHRAQGAARKIIDLKQAYEQAPLVSQKLFSQRKG